MEMTWAVTMKSRQEAKTNNKTQQAALKILYLHKSSLLQSANLIFKRPAFRMQTNQFTQYLCLDPQAHTGAHAWA